jgi:hypothetical protein
MSLVDCYKCYFVTYVAGLDVSVYVTKLCVSYSPERCLRAVVFNLGYAKTYQSERDTGTS